MPVALDSETALPRDARDARDLRSRIALAVGIGLAYYLAARLGYAFTIQPANVAVVWPPAGLLLAALVLLDSRARPPVLLAALVAGFLADRQNGLSTLIAASGSAVNVVESVVASTVLRRIVGRRATLGSLRDVGALVLGAAVVSNACTALLGAFVITHGSLVNYWRAWLVWWVGDGMGILMIAPAVLAGVDFVRRRVRIRPRRAIEAVALLGGVGVAGHLLFSMQSEWSGIIGGPAYIVFPLLIWIALRFGPRGAAFSILIMCCVTAWDAAHIEGLFGAAGASPMRQVLDMYSYLALASLSTLIPAAILNERSVAERELRESESRFRQMAEHIREAFVIVDVATGKALYVSPTWSEIWGRTIEQAQDYRNWIDAVHPDDQAMVRESQDAVRGGEARTTIFRVTRPDGVMRWVRSRIFPVRDEDGAVYRLAGISEDITGVRRTEEQLAQSQRMDAVGRLAGGVAHDFNNLLTVILNYCDALLLDLPAPDSRRDDVTAIREAGESAARLTRQLLTFSRKEVVQPRTLHVNAVIERTGTLLTRLIGEDVELTISLNALVDNVLADPGQLEQLIVNLAVNARDAMPHGGRLSIESSTVIFDEPPKDDGGTPLRAGEYVGITVRDSGVGMDEATRLRIFEPFFTTKGAGKGTGLGLSTVYGVVRQSGGFITVQTALGAGSSFKVFLPLHVGAQVDAAPQADLASSLRGTETILVVEDDESVRAIVRDVLRRQGYRVLVMSEGAAALDLVSRFEEHIHLLITDVIMPGMNGRVLSDRFNKLRPDAGILFVSGYTDETVFPHGILEADVHYLEKPFTAVSLGQKVREVLDRAGPAGASKG
ncbi:MAG: MASE1 domain-containing protein [bacterium]